MSPEPTSVNFPSSLDSAVTLGGDMRNLVELTLDASIDASTGTISVSEDITGINVPCSLLIGSELIWLTEKSGGDFINSVRGTESTTAASHTNGDSAYLVYSANLFNQLKRATLGIEEYLIGSPTELTISSGSITVTKSRHFIQPETGTSDDLATISGIPDGGQVTLTLSDPSTDTITIKHGTGNISCPGGLDLTLTAGGIVAYRRGLVVYILGGGAASTTGYALTGSLINFVPVNSSTYYFGLSSRAPGAAITAQKIYIPFPGTITKAYLSVDVTTPGTNQTSTISLRLNGATDTTVSSAIVTDTSFQAENNTSLSIPVVANDYVSFKWDTPVWGTPPGGIRFAWVLWIET